MPPADPPSLSTPRDVVLHAGTGKAGTTTIQAFLRDNRGRLAALGVLVPRSAGPARHSKLNLYMRTDEELAVSRRWQRREDRDAARFRRGFRRRLVAEIEEAAQPRVLFTDEEVFKASDGSLRRLQGILRPLAASLREVVYLRRQDDHLVSRYQQGVKLGWTQRLDAWAREDFTQLYDYAAALERHRALLAPDELVVRRYDRSCFSGGSLLQDFLDAVGIEARADEMEQGPDRNQSLDAESVELLRLLNLHRVEDLGETPGLIDNRDLVARLAPASSGPTLTLPEPVLDAFMEQWAESNRWVARELLGDRTGVLFPTPRRTAGTTSQQRLDPDRLDHFCALLELPTEVGARLRELAEREARPG